MPDDLRPPPESAHPTMPILWSYDRKERIEELQRAGIPFMPVCVPWAMLVPHEQQAQKNHSQTLKRLAERGGLSPCEALAILDDRPWKRMPNTQACVELSERIIAWNRRAALTINPEDEGQVERVARAHDPIGWEWHDKYKDDEHWAANIEMFRAEKLSKARAALKALSDA